MGMDALISNWSASYHLHRELKGHYGALAQVATETGYSRQHVIDVVKGYRKNSYIFREAQRILLEKKSKNAPANDKTFRI